MDVEETGGIAGGVVETLGEAGTGFDDRGMEELSIGHKNSGLGRQNVQFSELQWLYYSGVIVSASQSRLR